MSDLKLLRKIQSMVERYLFPTCYDTEDIATKIYIELLEKERYLSWLYVKNRCIDEMRRAKRIRFCPLETFEHLQAPSRRESINDSAELINILMRQSVFSSEEKILIYRSFYKDEKVSSEKIDPIINKLKKELKLLLTSTKGVTK